ncbi:MULTISPECIES: class I SAM-dependent methyltransferase [Amycolatopsis]|uniref:Methyltransferase domain-containing protein n=1 Tax=Amycolatopsis rubida TaxID=112413 RepID=A0A1I5GDK4_9PSEU|nr:MULTISPECIES: class I SAM-dependent methyltransferase [Amycolatopsis]OAP27498.1 Malonyl-[acyl-carrier protein] O-methyltransferase [Amycolatopsis sp. M39]SFO34054.1 Methyltransferase domain-containing protein [Amycolatopsis rubida]
MSDPSTDAELRARRASSFGDEASAYARHRPDYPLAALEWGMSGANRPVRDVLDLAAGTGKLTEGLASLGRSVTAVEPDPGMLAELSRLLPDVPALPGKAEDIPLPDESVDAVFVGQALHWFDLAPAFAQIRRVLRPGGAVVALWNHDDESVPWVLEFARLVRTGISRGFADSEQPLRADGFGPFEQDRFAHTHRRSIDSLLATVATHSHLLVASEQDRERTLAQARAYLESVPETGTGEFDYPLVTTVLRARRG